MWSEQELGKLAELMPVLGRNYGAYQEYLPGRTYNQIKSQCHNTWNKAQDGSTHSSSETPRSPRRAGKARKPRWRPSSTGWRQSSSRPCRRTRRRQRSEFCTVGTDF